MFEGRPAKPGDPFRFGLTLALRLAVTLGPHEMIGPCHDGARMNHPITGVRLLGRGLRVA